VVHTNGAIPELQDDFRTGKAYTIPQASRLAGISPGTARRWLVVVGGRNDDEARDPALMLSFLELIELVVVARFRAPPKPVKLERIAQAHAFARQEFDLPYPFASLKLLKLGGHVLHKFDEATGARQSEWMALDMGGHYTLPGLVQTELEQNVEYPDRFAGVWYPHGRDVPVIVDPHIAAGRPTIKGRGITVETLRRRWFAGETFKALARDYGLPPEMVEKAVQAAATAA
jgi:uncharacterized protein (DUF433 family)